LNYSCSIFAAPKIFDLPLKILTNVLPKNVRDSLKVYGHNKGEWLPALHEQIPVDELPAEYGGTKPKYQTKMAKVAQLEFWTQLVTQAQKAVERDMEETSNANGKGQPHHHHYKDPYQQDETLPGAASDHHPANPIESGSASLNRNSAITIHLNFLVLVIARVLGFK
jgi:hypothetical protein